ncbi:hypothetical protein EIP73_05345 [Xylella fastidiosa subsp. pauca]|nr:hypothetical protein EIP73_05345 [Xylella fastidiosa subsp. pauca]
MTALTATAHTLTMSATTLRIIEHPHCHSLRVTPHGTVTTRLRNHDVPITKNTAILCHSNPLLDVKLPGNVICTNATQVRDSNLTIKHI